MKSQQTAWLLAAVLGMLLAPGSVQGADSLAPGTAIKPSLVRGHHLMARSEQPQVIGTLHDLLPDDEVAQPKQNALRRSVTIIKTTVITVTETTILQKVSTKSVSLFYTLTATSPCVAKVQPEQQKGGQVDVKPVINVKPNYYQAAIAANPFMYNYSMFLNKPMFPSKPLGAQPVRDVKPVEAKPVDDKPVAAKPVDDKPVVAKPVDNKPVVANPVGDKPVVAKPIEMKPIINKPFTYDYSMFLNRPNVARPVETLPVRDVKPFVPKPFEMKPITNRPFAYDYSMFFNRPHVSRPIKVEPVESKPDESKQVVSTPDEANPVEATLVKDAPIEHNPVEETPGEPSPVYVYKPNVNEEFTKLMGEFTTLMSQLSAPPSQSALMRRFNFVSNKEEVWKSQEKAVHHEELADELKLLVKQIKDVKRQPHAFFEHLEMFVSYMEEI